jgi:hypothetical protein
MKMRATNKIAIGFVLLGAIGFLGQKAYTKVKLMGVEMKPVKSTDFCLVALDPKSNVKVLTANRMAQLVISGDGELENQSSQDGGGATSGSIKLRIPVKELLGLLNGDTQSVDPFIQKLSTLDENEQITEEAPVWTRDAIESAIAGNKAKAAQLEKDLGVNLDGTPQTMMNTQAIFTGIRIKIPLTLNIPNVTGDSVKGFTSVMYRARLLRSFEKETQDKKFFDRSGLNDQYQTFVKRVLAAGKLDRVDKSLKGIFADAVDNEVVTNANRIGKSCLVLANNSMITQAKVVEQTGNNATSYDLSLILTPEAQKRLWKFSAEGGKRIIVVSRGVPIAVAMIGTELAGEELVIKQIADKDLVEDAVKQFANR